MTFPQLAVCALINAVVGLAQADSGMPGRGMGYGPGTPDPSREFMQMFQNMGGTPMMGSGMGVGMTADLTVGPDGTAYVIRSTAATGSAVSNSWQFELIALSALDGRAKWQLALPGTRASSPVLGSDGLIYLTVDNYSMFYTNFVSGGTMMTQAQATVNDGQLLVIAPTAGSATIRYKIQTASDVLSVPRIVADAGGSYLIYVLGYDMMSWTSMPATAGTTFAPGEKTLYVYRPDGSLKFSVKLSQSGSGMMHP